MKILDRATNNGCVINPADLQNIRQCYIISSIVIPSVNSKQNKTINDTKDIPIKRYNIGFTQREVAITIIGSGQLSCIELVRAGSHMVHTDLLAAVGSPSVTYPSFPSSGIVKEIIR
jgi:hypothetical protein